MPDPNDINTRLEKFYTEHPEARPADSVVSLHYIDGDWYWCCPEEVGVALAESDVIRMAVCPDALHRDALVRWLVGRVPGQMEVGAVPQDGARAYDVVTSDQNGFDLHHHADTLLEALLAAAEAVGGEG